MSILIGTPMFGGQCTRDYFESCLNLKEDLAEIGVNHDWLTVANESLITRGRNTIADTFLKTDFEALLFIDADIRFRTEDVAKLWNLNAPIAVGAYRMKCEEIKYSAWRDNKIVNLQDIEGKEPLKVDYAATGFMMIQRDVFEQMKDKVEKYDEEGERYAFFQDPIIDGMHMSEDYFFCKTWRDMGGEILLDPTIELGHIGTVEYAS